MRANLKKIYRRIIGATVCRLRGHRFFRVESKSGDMIAALLPVDECQRCGYWKADPPSVILGIDRTEIAWWRNRK